MRRGSRCDLRIADHRPVFRVFGVSTTSAQWVSGCGSQPLYSHCNGFYQPAELVADWPRGGVVSAHGAFRNRARRKARSPFPEPASAGKLQYSLPEQASPLFSHSSSRSRLTDCSKLTHPRSVSILGHF